MSNKTTMMKLALLRNDKSERNEKHWKARVRPQDVSALLPERMCTF